MIVINVLLEVIGRVADKLKEFVRKGFSFADKLNLWIISTKIHQSISFLNGNTYFFVRSPTYFLPFLRSSSSRQGKVSGWNISFVGILRSLAVIQVTLEKNHLCCYKGDDALGASKESNLSFVRISTEKNYKRKYDLKICFENLCLFLSQFFSSY